MKKSLFFVKKYILYLLKSKNIHSAQSPFLYEFLSKILYKNTNEKDYQKIELTRKKLLRSSKKIKIQDFGAGSCINQNQTRKIKDIAKNSSKRKKYSQLLHRIVKFYESKNILELGTSLGISSLYLAKGNKQAKVYTLEGCPETSKQAQLNFNFNNASNINLILGEFDSTLSNTLDKMKNIDLVFIDGNHQQNATISYFEKCLNYAHNDTIFIFDDIYWSIGMENAWKKIKSHSKTTLTIDLFHIGIVFIKSELSKENNIIRY